MTKIIPGILVHSLKELKEKLKKVSWAKKVHIDIMDGKFVKNKTIQIQTLRKAFPKMDVQIHLMAKKPETYVKQFAKLGAKEFIFHTEATRKTEKIIQDVKKEGMKAGIAFNPETKVEKHKEAVKEAELALVMTIHPGFSGQKFMKRPLSKIKKIKNYNKKIKVGVDGGCHINTCKYIKAAGADFAIASSEVTDADEPRKAYKELSKKTK